MRRGGARACAALLVALGWGLAHPRGSGATDAGLPARDPGFDPSGSHPLPNASERREPSTTRGCGCRSFPLRPR